jgi:hypothetical protein
MLFFIIFRDKGLINILKAISSNGENLIKMVLLGIILLLIYGIIIYRFYDTAFNTDFGDNLNSSFFITVMSIIKDGFTLGLTNKLNYAPYPLTENEDTNNFYGRWILDFSFWIIITTLYTNLIFGIIIDKFGVLRDENNTLN